MHAPVVEEGDLTQMCPELIEDPNLPEQAEFVITCVEACCRINGAALPVQFTISVENEIKTLVFGKKH